MSKVRFFTPGTPLTKGSMRSFVHARAGKVVTMAANKKLCCWESDVKFFAASAWRARPMQGAVSLSLVFTFGRPRSHFRSGKKSDELRDDAPRMMATHGRKDLDKLIRAVLDAMTGVVYVDDGQVCNIDARKRYGEKPGVEVEVDDG